MSILIKGMKMPTTYPLTVTIYPDGQVLSETVGAKDIHGEAVSIPPHGRLIDADALEQEAQKRLLKCNKVVRGKWIDEPIKGVRYHCSVCQGRFDYTWHYCPNCGADMRPTSMSGANGEES